MVLEAFQNHINEKLAFLTESKLLIAISGGIDSVVLTHLCAQSHLNFSLAHCNFNLRGDESDADEIFITDLADLLDKEVFIQHFDTTAYAEEHKCSIQMAARELRYNWFTELAEQLNFDYVLTAHHADDNLETFLINFTRGTGLEGLTGIPVVNGLFVRPLLPFSNETIKVFAEENRIKWREDSSNASIKYLRNKLRHEVIPILKTINPNLLQSFQSTLDNLNDTADIVEESVQAVLNRAIVNIDSKKVIYDISEFNKLNNPKAYLFEIFKDYGFKEWDDVLNLLEAQPGKFVHSDSHRLIKDREHLILTDAEPLIFEPKKIPDLNDPVETPLGSLVFTEVDVVFNDASTSIFVDKDKLQFPLILRIRKEGDVIFPSGMSGKKTLSKYFKDEKFSLLDKENALLLCSSEAIVWILGKRADDRFKVDSNTKKIIKIELIS
ncbi:tRNA lysidine(34) synthetase TilS [Gaetbulibacter sp. M240]|uniref:tRNA lysidine(34) synthetase TilS n=1 Tax=Gaetbulibacter sp. M240 TaxID=3126511 RepID=UPI00374F95EE